VTYPGLGGQQPPPLNASPAQQLVPGVQPGTTGQIVASRVIIIGSGGDLFVYEPTAALGNLKVSISGTVGGGTDSFGNNFVFEVGVYDDTGGFFTQLGAGFITFGTGHLATGWTANTTVENDASGNLNLGATGALFFNGTMMTVP